MFNKKIKIEIKHRVTGSVLFEYACVENTIRKTVEEAVQKNIDLSYANLRSANLSYANLRSANLSYADLSYADLSYAKLSSANLSYANLSYANLRSANLSYANLISANLSYAKLSSAKLRSANLSYADLRSADLSYANLSSANLSYADLSYADLSYADLSYAKLSYANLLYTLSVIHWTDISDKLNLEMMRWDALVVGDEKMDAWAKGGKCPFSDSKIPRLFKFNEKKEIWKKGKPKMNIVELYKALCEEKKIIIK